MQDAPDLCIAVASADMNRVSPTGNKSHPSPNPRLTCSEDLGLSE